jgi:hypothetical protein
MVRKTYVGESLHYHYDGVCYAAIVVCVRPDGFVNLAVFGNGVNRIPPVVNVDADRWSPGPFIVERIGQSAGDLKNNTWHYASHGCG